MDEKQSVNPEYVIDSAAQQDSSPLLAATVADKPTPVVASAPAQDAVFEMDNFPATRGNIAPSVAEAEGNAPAPNVGAEKETIKVNPDANLSPKQIEANNKANAKLRKRYQIDSDDLLSKNEVISGFVIAKNETVVRRYNCLVASKGNGSVVLTTKRLLINAGERAELPIENVKGIRFSKQTALRIMRFVFAILFMGAGLFVALLPTVGKSLFSDMSWCNTAIKVLLYFAGIVLFIIGLPCLIASIYKSFYFMIYADNVSAFVDYKTARDVKRESKGLCKSVLAKAGKESDKAARELGALILEIKEGRYGN